MWDIISQATQILRDTFWMMPLGALVGVAAGAIPGFGASNTIIIFLPLTLAIEPTAALIFIAALFAGVRLGGAIPAVLVNIPGTGSSSVTAFDGYPMCMQGKAGEGLGIACFASFFGGILSAAVTLVTAPFLAAVALSLSDVEIFILVLSAIVLVGNLATDNPAKGWLAGFFGLLLGTMGTDPMWGTVRGNFDIKWLADGVPVIPALVGLFAISEALALVNRDNVVTDLSVMKKGGNVLKEIIGGFRVALRYPVDLIRSALIGTGVGALPGAGANIGSFLSYQQAVTHARDNSQFGKGDPRGIIAGEAADNGVASGSLIPLLTLGIPGSSSTAVMLVVMMAHGLPVGPRLATDEPGIFYAILGSLFVANLWMFVFGVIICVYMVRIIDIPTRILAPAIVAFSLVGAYFARGYVFDMWLALAFGLLGYVLRRTGYPPAAVLLGIILTPILEASFFTGLRIGFGDPLVFFTRPIALGLWIALFIVIGGPPLVRMYRNWKKNRA